MQDFNMNILIVKLTPSIRVYSLLGFSLPLDSSVFQRTTEKNLIFPHDWEQHKGHLCLNLQRDSISPVTDGSHFPAPEL